MKIVTAETIAELLSRAAASPRKRMNLNLHAEPTTRLAGFLMLELRGLMYARTAIGSAGGNS